MTSPIPQPRGLPYLGNIFDINVNNTWVSLQKLWEKYGEIFSITVIGKEVVFVASVALCEELCDEKRFRKFIGGPIIEIRCLVHDALFSAYDDEPSWAVHHRILAPTLAQDSTAQNFDLLNQCVTELMHKWQGMGSNSPFTVIDDLNRLNLESTTLCFCGKKLECLTGPEPAVLSAMERFSVECIKRPTRPNIVNRLLYQSNFDKDIKYLRNWASEILQDRKNGKNHRQDMLYCMLRNKDPQTGKGLDDRQIIDEILTMQIAASTEACVVATAIYYLLKNPECLQKAREEITSVVGVSPLTYELLNKLPYCSAVVYETLRMSSAAAGLNIEPLPSAQGPSLLAGGRYSVPPKQAMLIVMHGVNHDATVLDEPNAFRPERMMGEAFAKLPDGAKKWFGNGKRGCLGRHFAWMWCMTTLVVLLREMDMEMADVNYTLKQDGWFNLRPVEFFVKMRPKGK